MGGSIGTAILESLPEYMSSPEEGGHAGLAEGEELWGEPPCLSEKCLCVLTCVCVSMFVCENVFTSLLKAQGWPSVPQLVSQCGDPKCGDVGCGLGIRPLTRLNWFAMFTRCLERYALEL